MRKQWKQWQTIFLGSKITADGDCSHQIKRRLLLGRKWSESLSCVQLLVIPYSPWNSLGQNTGVGSLSLLQGIFPTQVSHIVGRFWKAMTNLHSILKSRDITLPTKVCLVKAMVSPVVMYGCESWPIKKAEPRGINALSCGVGEGSWESPGLQGD